MQSHPRQAAALLLDPVGKQQQAKALLETLSSSLFLPKECACVRACVAKAGVGKVFQSWSTMASKI